MGSLASWNIWALAVSLAMASLPSSRLKALQDRPRVQDCLLQVPGNPSRLLPAYRHWGVQGFIAGCGEHLLVQNP
eukprot:7211119-Lingulodinium_polyedra.AAC.1